MIPITRPSPGVWKPAALALALAGSGGWGAGAEAATVQGFDAPGGTPSVVGEWSEVVPWPSVAIHAHLLPTGEVLFWDRHDFGPAGNGTPRLWDPVGGGFTLLPEPGEDYDVFCSGHSFLADGRLLVTGGHVADHVGLASASTFDPVARSWTRHADMNAGRWYPTNATLASGDVLVLSGQISPADGNNPLPQVFAAGSGTWRDLTGAIRHLPLYPFLHLAPDGRVFNAGPQPETAYLDTAGTGAWTAVDVTTHGYRDYGSSVMYEPGRVLIAGGSPPDFSTTTATAEVIDLADPSPAWTDTSPMAYPRRQHNLTLLPDGKVLATGGSAKPGFNDATGAVLPAEVWDPATGGWTTLAGMHEARLYHSTALLLPDGRVLSAGGGHPRDAEHGDPDHPSAEVFSPPYLFRGPRPTATSAPAVVGYGQSFSVGTPDEIAAVTWIRLSSVTHAFNQDQRFLRLAFAPVPGGLAVTAPAGPTLAPPGTYMMFLLDGAGVPSVARMIRIGTGGLFTVSPCRLVDTRNPDGPLGGPALTPSGQRTFALTGACKVPATARALSVNLTVTGTTAPGFLSLFPAGQPLPLVSSIGFAPGQTRANNAILSLAADGSGAIAVQNGSAGALHLLLDVNGYFE